MDVDVELGGLQDLEDRLAHARAGLKSLERDLSAELLDAAPPMVVAESPRMRPRLWGVGDVWTLPPGGWVAPRVLLPDGADQLQGHVQELLNGN